MAARYRKPTIEEQGGLEIYLAALKEENNGFGSAQVIRMLDSKATNTSIGNIVGRLPSTIKHWREVRQDELKTAKKGITK